MRTVGKALWNEADNFFTYLCHVTNLLSNTETTNSEMIFAEQQLFFGDFNFLLCTRVEARDMLFMTDLNRP